MGLRGMEKGLVMVLVVTLWAGAMAQSSCTNTLITLSPCLNYITGNSSTPSAACCSQLAGVVTSQPQCLCLVINGSGAGLGLNINQTLAMRLPAACNVQTPSVSLCNASGGPGTSPAGGPTSSRPQTPPSAGGGPSSDSTSMKPTFSLFVPLFVLSLITVIFT
ncbi:bifunctional inhibitor/lipid-transfer protein/seed storage 2S albumin superfamily protein [Tasmannia lanceolata]|uniref:bifunctional inhibitor/lipid-transfer protein/seed storage 2S albumin superfamily protein n=1 Tax=Tasmannia lanceolata TaxID=3420 RepID=UPI00406310CA